MEEDRNTTGGFSAADRAAIAARVALQPAWAVEYSADARLGYARVTCTTGKAQTLLIAHAGEGTGFAVRWPDGSRLWTGIGCSLACVLQHLEFMMGEAARNFEAERPGKDIRGPAS